MGKHEQLQIFQSRKVRSVWDDEEEQWYFSVVDVVSILTDSKDPQAYWRKLKQRLKNEGNETVTNCHALKMIAADGEMRVLAIPSSAPNVPLTIRIQRACFLSMILHHSTKNSDNYLYSR